MFVLRTGLPGNGKTLNTIKEVDLKAAKEGRTVYYHNIRGFNPDADVLQAVWVEFDDPFKWHELPQDAIIVIDEAQTFFRVRKQGAQVPDYISAAETLRHRGHDLHCITQAPGLIDVHFRKLCNLHIHYVRGHKGKVIKRWEFERVNPDVERKNAFSDGSSTRILLDKNYFGVYQSVSEGASHHMRFRPPKQLYVLLIALLVIGILGWRFYERRLAPAAEAASAPAASPVNDDVQLAPAELQVSDRSRREAPVTVEEYIDARIERVPGVPSSAPIYDQLTKPVSYPRTFCISTADEELIRRNVLRMEIGYKAGRLHGCRCNTQQGTRVNLDFSTCMNYVENGAFDPAVPDRQPTGQVAGGGGDVGAHTYATGPVVSGIVNVKGAIQ